MAYMRGLLASTRRMYLHVYIYIYIFVDEDLFR